MVALLVVIGVPVLLCLGLAYGTLSPREWAVGLLGWFAALLLWLTVVKLTAKKALASNSGPATALDERTRKRILRRIWISKVWVGLLAVLLPIGIANGLAHRAWLPTIVGVGISLLWMYVEIQEIRRRRKQFNLSRQ
jgi:hypothetical protein